MKWGLDIFVMLENIEIIAGTYEEFVLGFQVKRNGNELSLVQTFANHDHSASVRCVAAKGKLLVSGGADETVHVYDMAVRKESDILMEHKGTVNCVDITPDGSHLITGGEDGMLAIFKTGSYNLEKSWKSCHKDAGIVGISVHPSGKMAFTVGADATLRTWNLVSGRRAYVTTLGRKKELGWQIIGVQWSPSGKLYAIGMRTKIDVYNVDVAGVVWSIPSQVKINCYLFLNDNLLLVGYDHGKLSLYDIEEKKCILEKQVYDQRVKSVSSVIENDVTFVVTASSIGEIILWKYVDEIFVEMARVKSGCRITCLTISSCGFPEVKVKQEKDELLGDEKNLEELAEYLLELKKLTKSKSNKETVTIEGDTDCFSYEGKVSSSSEQLETEYASGSNTSSGLKLKLPGGGKKGKKKLKQKPKLAPQESLEDSGIVPKQKRKSESSSSVLEPTPKHFKRKAKKQKNVLAQNTWKETKNVGTSPVKKQKTQKKKGTWQVKNIT